MKRIVAVAVFGIVVTLGMLVYSRLQIESLRRQNKALSAAVSSLKKDIDALKMKCERMTSRNEEGFSRWFKKNTSSNIIGKKNMGGDSKEYLERLPEAFQLDKTKWTRLSAVNGVKMQIVSRTVRSADCDYHFWRWASFDEHGSLYELSEEQGVYTSVNYEGYLGDL